MNSSASRVQPMTSSKPKKGPRKDFDSSVKEYKAYIEIKRRNEKRNKRIISQSLVI